jgi:hypothetical protein
MNILLEVTYKWVLLRSVLDWGKKASHKYLIWCVLFTFLGFGDRIGLEEFFYGVLISVIPQFAVIFRITSL